MLYACSTVNPHVDDHDRTEKSVYHKWRTIEVFNALQGGTRRDVINCLMQRKL